MPTKLQNVFLLAVSLCVESVLSSAYYNNDYFERISKNEVDEHWTREVDAHSFIKDSFSCEVIHTGSKSDRTLYHEILITEKVQRPPTIVIVPRNESDYNFLIDIKYADFSGTLDIPVGYSKAECYIVPPYKPLMYAGFQVDATAPFDAYALRENDENLEAEGEATKEGKEKDRSNVKNKCPGLDIEALSKCRVMGPPVTYDLPVHPFFLTASRKVNKTDITLFTVISIERLRRLVDLAENWDGPMSVAVEITNKGKQLPLFINTWLNTPKLRRNADIHILFDDNFPIINYSSKLFPINYLRDLAFKNARTQLVMYVEGDYVVGKDFKESLTKWIPQFMNESGTVFIAPALDAVKGVKLNQIPRNKEELAKILNKPLKQRNIVEKFHKSYIPQHIPHWLEQNEVYNCNITAGEIFEPYFVAHRNIVLYDEVFNGCLYDKLSHVDNMRNLGFKLKMIPDAFIIHLSHADLKKYQNWCYGYKLDKRYALKKNFFDAVSKGFKGLLENRYYPPWLSVTPGSIQAKCSKLEEAYKLNSLTQKIEKARNQNQFMKALLVFFLALFAVAIVVCLNKKSTKEATISSPLPIKRG